MNITTRWDVCQAVTADSLLLLACGSFCPQFCLKCLKSSSTGLRSGGHWIKLPVLPWEAYGSFAVCFVIIVCSVKAVLSVLQHSDESEQIVSYPAASVCSHIINKHRSSSSTGSQTCPWHHFTASVMSDRWCVASDEVVSFLFHTYFIILVQDDLIFFSPKSLVPELGSFVFSGVFWENLSWPSCSSVSPVMCTLS